MEYRFPILNPEVSEEKTDGYRHRACGKMLMGMTVYLSNRDGLFPLSGDGSVETVVVPYCAECDDTPPTHGTITNDGVVSHPSIEMVTNS